ncbi:hypothetical protein QAD02_018312 [Eretmocerus hayati]|uniref:Uncharacterized protein n=1 Tax=Eretmocerus hayati TaxID=131215 RepID=A0ACC2PGH4_9HYME|nr:hypothetical protein QAD02_018312 [Eretmocerus hayati]
MLDLVLRLLNYCLLLSNIAAAVTVERITPPVEHGEGPHWDVSTNKLYHVDISSQKIWQVDPITGQRTFIYLKDGPVGVVVTVENSPNELVVGCGRDVVLVKWDGEQNITNPDPRKYFQKLASLDIDRNDTRVNDGKCDPAGRFWIGTMGLEINDHIEEGRGSLYRIGQNLTPTNLVTSVTVSNGLVWGPKNDVMYYIDSPTRKIVAFDYNLEYGSLGSKRVVFDLERNHVIGIPDGMTIDAHGDLWIALYKGFAVIQVDPIHGRRLRTIDLPAPRITSVAFGGPKLDILYVTSSRFGMDDEEKKKYPSSGSVFAIKGLGVQGLPQTSFKYSKVRTGRSQKGSMSGQSYRSQFRGGDIIDMGFD